MTKTQKIVLGLVTIISAFLLIGSISSPSSKVGGVYNQVTSYFYDGISVGTGGQFAVTSAGALTTSGTITSTGTVTATGAVTLGSITNGLNSYRPVLSPAADVTLTVGQTGSIVNMGVAGLDVTLPTATVATGVHYRFVVSAAVATTDMTIIAAPADIIEGTLIVAGAVVDCDAADILTFVIDGENVGDYVDVYSNGVKWMIGDSGALTASKLTCSG